VILAFTGFIGFEAAAVLGEEAAEPKRVIPRAILGTVIVATVYFVFVTWSQAVGYGVSGAGRWAADPTALATLSDRYVGHWFSTLVDIVVVVDSFVAALAGVHLTARTLFAMGRDRAIPASRTTGSSTSSRRLLRLRCVGTRSTRRSGRARPRRSATRCGSLSACSSPG